MPADRQETTRAERPGCARLLGVRLGDVQPCDEPGGWPEFEVTLRFYVSSDDPVVIERERRHIFDRLPELAMELDCAPSESRQESSTEAMRRALSHRVRSRVRQMSGLEDTTMREVVAIWKGEDIGDQFKAAAITHEIEAHGFRVGQA